MTVSLMEAPELNTWLERVFLPGSIVDARTRAEFDAGHIPFAVHVDWEEWNDRPPRGVKLELWEPGYWGALKNPWNGNFSERLSQLGLRNDKPIVVYADGLKSKGREGRIAWMLLYLGASRVYILNGGWSAWLQAGGDTERIETCRFDGNFQIVPDSRRRVDMKKLINSCGSSEKFHAIDTRTADEFVGKSYEYQARTGHLPGALRVGYEELFDGDQRFVDSSKFFEIFPPHVANSQSAFTYCEVGVRASTYALLVEVYTGRVLPVYDASIMEWGIYRDLPILKLA
ncbi:MAG: hypothetical protein K2X77_21380 [Candidatus Obscuribacterales bacterium]|nr:hypothetical protein [Candidatus Obscuribacterales bacterium]